MYCYKLTLHDDINISRLKPKDIPEFTEKYGKKIGNKKDNFIFIDWPKASKGFDGIEFKPYNKNIIRKDEELIRDLLWYSTLDAESGVLFEPSQSIKKMELIGEKVDSKWIV